ncbi:MAG: 6-carboxytetrahydropterin synthase QueD [Candidatus Mcinerneyibacterium aminivorans]|uniref:6-carboxy-5,6,7,8-tetrahydropterin synthase n=1 Tax=Candidatus Mcinerneyibacterium aminivorans TaxID=2703815 RepID=A0A5D0MHZ9_9BACT|nr:MAG: 6-carboxytetrahydropterin synthase QueD [Candidatus Mcinerneyibacterium aminivorans]
MQELIITKIFSFGAAHNLDSYHGKCENLHGHNYRLEVSVKGVPDNEGMVIDYKVLKEIINKTVIEKLDHKYLNEVLDFSPTSENLLIWMKEKLENKLNSENYKLYKLVLWETESNKASIYV